MFLLYKLVAFLRRKGIRIIVYLDDFLILNQSKEGAERDFLLTVDLLEKCGFFIDRENLWAWPPNNENFWALL
jgi:hypothetical protein